MIRKALIKLCADLINEKREYAPLSYGWLNEETWRLVRRGGLASIRPQYVWGMLQAAALAKTLGHDHVAMIELGVAGGRGLQAMEAAGLEISKRVGIAVDCYGFDTGVGLPRPIDTRDLPNLYDFGDYRMDEARLRRQLTSAKLLLGPISETLPNFLKDVRAPIGFISIDVDLYSSTVDAFPLFDAADEQVLPRVYLYLDDSLGLTFSDFNGERLALREYNATRKNRKADLIHGLQFDLPWPLSTAKWPHMMYMLHCFDHPQYGQKDNLIPTSRAPAWTTD